MRRMVAAGFGSGLLARRLWGSDTGAGTLGALVAVAIGLVLLPSPWWIDLGVALVAVAISMWATAPMTDDPGWVSIDEIAGTLVAMVGLAGIPWVAAVVVARLLDIFKIAPGVAAAESLPPPLGITADDVVAGLYGLAVGWLITWLR
ncbi:MAG: phosphatidylglycerophosphatase A [Acidimicrobiia bacterium]|nr:phosphatidylglycerophosphatase A [Acidimicrobiia bacterium]